jgi:YNFM family putative membrane transporter
MSGFKGTDRFSGDATADAVMAADQSAAIEQIPAVASFVGNDKRAVIAVTLAGIGAFFNLNATQPLLPLFEQIFHASKAAVGITVSAATLAVAFSAPFWGALAERAGRRRIIVLSIFLLALPTILAATAGNLSQLVFWRLLQGAVMPGVFGVTIAYIAEEWPRHRVPQVISIYVSGTVLGGYLGRIFTGVAATHHLFPFVEPSWRVGFVVIGACDLVFGVLLWRWLPPDSAPSDGATETTAFGQHFRNPQLLATFAVGFNVLFFLMATFTYVTFYLAAPPFWLSPAQLSALFTVYLVGLVVTPFGGVWISRVGSRTALIVSIAVGIVGILLTLIQSLPVILLGLVLCSSGVFICQSASTTYIQREAHAGGRASAAGLYVMFYYMGGSAGGVLPGMLWHYGQWKACVALIIIVQLITVAIAGAIWKGREDALPGQLGHADGGSQGWNGKKVEQ